MNIPTYLVPIGPVVSGKRLKCKSLTTSTMIDDDGHQEMAITWDGFELATLFVIGTDCTGSRKSIYHTISTSMAPLYNLLQNWRI